MKQGILALWYALVCLLMPAVLPGARADTVFTVGVVPQFESRRLHEIWRPILDRIEQETGYRLELIGSPTIPAFEDEFVAGKFDFVYMNPFHQLMAAEAQRYQPLLRDIGNVSRGVLVVRKGGAVRRVEDLQGRAIAFPAPNALGASLQMRQELTDDFGLAFNASYVKTHDSVYLNVLLGEADAGGGVQQTLDRQRQAFRDNLEVIHTTRPMATHPFSVHPRVPAEQAERVRQALLRLAGTPEGRELFAEVPIKELGMATMDDYAPLRELGLDRFYIRSR